MEALSAAMAADESSNYVLAKELYTKFLVELRRKGERYQVDFAPEMAVVGDRLEQITIQLERGVVRRQKDEMKRVYTKHAPPCVGRDDQLSELNEFCLPARFPEMFFGKKRQAHGMLLYGLAGTGKTFTVASIIEKLRGSNVVTSHIDLKQALRQPLSKLSQRLMALQGLLLHKSMGVFLFVDNLDLLQGSSGAADVLYKFLKENIGREHNGCIVVGATSKPDVISTRIRSFFERHVFYDLPEGRKRRHVCEAFLAWAGVQPEGAWEKLLSKLELDTELWNFRELMLTFKLAMLRRVEVQPKFGRLDAATAYPRIWVEDVEYVLRSDQQIHATREEVAIQREADIEKVRSFIGRKSTK